MAAIFHWCESNEVGEVETQDISNINFGSVDSPNLVPASNPIIRGNDSFEKYIRILFTGTWTEISNMLFWKSAGVYKTGEVIKAVANVAYAQPSETPNADSNIPITEETALTINSAEGESTIIYGVTGVSGYTKYIRLQTHSTVSTETGAGNTKTFLFQYDET